MLFGARKGEGHRFDAPGLPELRLGGVDERPATALLDLSARAATPAVRRRLIDDTSGNPPALLELPAALTAV
jgi:hypothetical protein